MPLPAVVVNPTKVGNVGSARATITSVCTEHGWSQPLWLETTEEDPGQGQARLAIESGADVVLVCGGDGTVRSAAQALAGSGVTMALVPAGTGNLLARNLEMTLDDFTESTRVALTGDDRPIDVGWMSVDSAEENVFLVMAGMGFDAEIMANAPEALKARVGAMAYIVSGLRHFNGRRTRVTITVDDDEPVNRRVRTVVIGNVGRLLGGLVLMPDAKIDDGRLDMISLAPSGVVGWAAVAAQVMTRRRKGHPRVEHWQGHRITVEASEPHTAQLDGDPIGDATLIQVRVDPGALVVRVDADQASTIGDTVREAAQDLTHGLTRERSRVPGRARAES